MSSALLLSPHNDDETLFAAFTVIRYQPTVVVCFESTGDYGDADLRARETRAAVNILGGRGTVQLRGAGDLRACFADLDQRFAPEVVFAPHVYSSHAQHVAVSLAADAVFGARVRNYHTYAKPAWNNSAAPKKVRHGEKIVPSPEWIDLKLRALLCYQSQIRHPRAAQFFLWDLNEYMESMR